jgi:hypothetical protein
MRRVDPEALDRAVQLVSEGHSARSAAAKCGISHPTLLGACAARGVAAPRKPSRPTLSEATSRVRAIPEESRKPGGVGLEAAREFGALAGPAEVLAPEAAATVLRCVAKGLALELACRRAGVAPAAAAEWLARAEEGAEPWASWMTLVGQAQAAGVEELHDIIRSGRPGWQSAGWLLERTRPSDYGKRLEVSAAVAASPLAEADTETLLAVVQAYAAGRG